MSRQDLLQALDAYAPGDSHEAEMTRRLRDFVAASEECFRREMLVGHITGSAFVVDKARTHTLLTHHRKLGKWLQLGGHADGESNVLRVALREAMEESGVDAVRAVSDAIFDIDIHVIPERKNEPEHFHYDVRFLLEADRGVPLRITRESKELAWVELTRVEEYTREESMLRMVRKALLLFQGPHSFHG